MIILSSREDVDVLQAVNERFYDADYIFTYEQGFNVAIAFTDFLDPVNSVLEPSYGEFKFYANEWGYDEND